MLAHLEIKPRSELTPDALETGSYPESGAWHYDRSNLFVSAEVRDQIYEAATSLGLDFSPGFWQFG